MSLEDIFNRPLDLIIGEQKYKLEFDNTAYAMLEELTKKGVYKIDELLSDNNLTLAECKDLVCCGLMKHNNPIVVEEIRKQLDDNPSIWALNNFAIMMAWRKPLLPPDIIKNLEDLGEKVKETKKKVKKKKTY